MPAYSIPVHIPAVSIDECLLDEEFDITGLTPPLDRKPSINRRLWLCDDMPWEEIDGEDVESI